jgi:hypothetical protein
LASAVTMRCAFLAAMHNVVMGLEGGSLRPANGSQ